MLNFLNLMLMGANHTSFGRIDSDGTYHATSLAEFKENMVDLTEEQIENVLTVPVYQFNFKKSPDRTHISPEAAEFQQVTGWGDGETLSPMSLAGIALRAVQWVWEKVDARLTRIEQQLAMQQPAEDQSDTEIKLGEKK